MVDKEKLAKISTELTENNADFMSSFRKNLDMYLQCPEITLKELSERSGVPYATLNTIIYGNASDVRVSTVIAVSKALNISVDELLGAGTFEPKMRESVRLVRGLPEHSVYLIRYFIRHQAKIHSMLSKKHDYISIMRPQIVNGVIATTNAVEPMMIDSVPEDIKAKAYIGIRIPSDYYMPYYLPDEIILVSADRKAHEGERCVVTSKGAIHVVVKKHIIENGKKIYVYSPLNTNVVIPDNLIVDKIGYVIGFLFPDGKWGIR